MRTRQTFSILFMLGLLASFLVPLTQANTGGPDPSGYAYIDSRETDGPVYQWLEISGPGHALDEHLADPDNGCAGPFDLDFPFPYYGNIYTEFCACANGYIQLTDSGSCPHFGGTLPPLPETPPPNGVLVPFSADMYVYPDVSHIYYYHDHARRLGIIEFLDLQWCCDLNAPHTFEIVLYPDGQIVMQYQLIRFLTNPHNGYVAGIESPDGTEGLGYAAGFVDTDSTVENDLAVLYTPGPDIYGFAFLEVDPDGQCEDAGREMVYWGELTNLSGFTTTYTLTYAVQPDNWTVGVLTETVGPITNSDVLYFPITVTIPLNAAFDDSAQVWFTATAALSPSIVATDTFWAGVADRDLVISKTLAPNVPPGPGGLMRYEVEVGNHVTPGGDCGADAYNLVITETLPPSLTVVNVYPAPVTTPTQTITWTLDELDEGDEAAFYVELRVPTTTAIPTTLTNTACVTTTGSVERGPFDNNCVAYTTVVTEPWLDLWVDKDVLAGNPIPGTLLTYEVDYANGGNVPAPGAIVTDSLPAGVTFVSATEPFNWSNGLLVWSFGPLDNEPWNPGVLTVTVLISPNLSDGFTLTNVAEVSLPGGPITGTLPDVDLSNNVFTLTLFVRDARADIWVDKLLPEIGGIPITPEPGGDYSYWIHYGNAGSADAITVTLTDTLPLSTSVLYAGTASGATPVLTHTGLVAWNITGVPTGTNGWVRVTVALDRAIPSGTVLTNSVIITNEVGYDITPTNDMDMVTATLLAADVTILKNAWPSGEVATGDCLTYTLIYRNGGALDATGVVISDVLPPGLMPVDVVTSGAALHLRPGTTYIWDVEDLSRGEGGFITITAWVEPSYAWPDPAGITNTAVITTTRGQGVIHLPDVATVYNPVRVLFRVYLPIVLRHSGG